MTINDFSTCQYVDLSENDILICALGYECRSYYLLEKNLATRNSSNTLIINFDDLQKECLSTNLLDEIDTIKPKTKVCSYAQGEKFQDDVISFLNEVVDSETTRKIYIDYSAMPRNWYCALPGRIENELQNRCLEREEKLFEEIKANREINGQAIATIALYADKLDTIQTDISEIKTDITILTAKANNN